MKTKMHLSLISLVGAILLFVFTSLAWFSVSEFIDIGLFSAQVGNKEIEYELYTSEDGVTYTLATELSFDVTVPGDTMYYRVVLTNPDTTDYSVVVVLSGIEIVLSDGSPYLGTAPLYEVVAVQSTIDSAIVVDDTLDALMNGQSVELSNTFTVVSEASETVDFTFSLLGTAGNEFQGLGLKIENLLFYFND